MKIRKVGRFLAAGVLLFLLLIGVLIMRLILVPFVWIEIGTYRDAFRRMKFLIYLHQEEMKALKELKK